jgi:hypothetical protein
MADGDYLFEDTPSQFLGPLQEQKKQLQQSDRFGPGVFNKERGTPRLQC